MSIREQVQSIGFWPEDTEIFEVESPVFHLSYRGVNKLLFLSPLKELLSLYEQAGGDVSRLAVLAPGVMASTSSPMPVSWQTPYFGGVRELTSDGSMQAATEAMLKASMPPPKPARPAGLITDAQLAAFKGINWDAVSKLKGCSAFTSLDAFAQFAANDGLDAMTEKQADMWLGRFKGAK